MDGSIGEHGEHRVILERRKRAVMVIGWLILGAWKVEKQDEELVERRCTTASSVRHLLVLVIDYPLRLCSCESPSFPSA
jgi:hypothetical protein